MKRKISTFIFLLAYCVNSYSQRYSSERTYDIIGLPGGSEIMDALKIGIPLLIVGFIIAYIFMWSKSNEEKQKGEGSTMGCIGVIIMGIGFLALLPLWAWIEAVGVTLVSIVFVIGIIFIIYEALKK